MLRRQRVLLDLIQLAGGSATTSQLTAWCFLYREEGDEALREAFYEFIRRKEGPLSFCIVQEAAALAAKGMVQAGEVQPHTRAIHTRYGSLSAAKLGAIIRSRYPDFLPPVKKSPPAVSTAGYEGHTVDGFLDLLVRSGIRAVLDVRNNPSARRYGFHRSTLQRLCSQIGIGYHHFPSLGIRSELRQDLTDQAARDRLFDRYARTTLVEETEAIDAVADLMRERPSVLVCMEALAQECHRSRLAAVVRDRTGLDIHHLVA